jgi:NAD dependent epimerase/dehydratase family enzyme
LLLASTRVVPEKLTEAGFEFEHPEIGEALKALLKKLTPQAVP